MLGPEPALAMDVQWRLQIRPHDPCLSVQLPRLHPVTDGPRTAPPSAASQPRLSNEEQKPPATPT